MVIVHGAWIPDATADYLQRGALCLWAEADAAQDSARTTIGGMHPRALAGEALAAFLGEKLGLRGAVPPRADRFVAMHLLLPSAGDAPLPSAELQRYVDEPAPDEFALASWLVEGYPLADPIRALNEVHFIASYAPDQFQLGASALFWHQFAQQLKALVARDGYIPALRAREIAPARGKGKAARPAVYQYHAGWEWASAAYEEAIAAYAAAMPLLCAAASASPATAPFAREALLRHCAESLLHEVVTGTPATAKLETQLSGTLLYNCAFPGREVRPYAVDQAAELTPELFGEWSAWHARLAERHAGAGFTLCFRLDEAPAEDPERWEMRFLVAGKRDPSYRLGLDEYWALGPREREAAGAALGAGFERLLLLALGDAARIYPALWSALETDRPAGFTLSLEQAFAFLQESAWVLEDAGYIVLLPAWWTPQGRRRAKIRLRASLAGGAPKVAAAGGGAFSLETLVQYQYGLAIGDQPVSEEEWRALVEAKTPLVRFRGQWMQLDRERMREMLELWQQRREEQPELTLLDLLRAGAEAGDELEVDHEGALGEIMARLQDKSRFAAIPDPPSLQGTLRDYQRRGVAWLHYLEELGLNPCLADDMGLGKTVQVIARLLDERAAGPVAPTLLIAPTSVLSNWRREVARFAPELRVLVHHGGARLSKEAAFAEAAQAHDVVVTSYTLARLDEKVLRGVRWGRVVLDEAQNIKNPQSAQARAVAKLPARHRLALTGTPVENRLLDLWSLFNFLNPGYLGKHPQFRKTFEVPIQRDNDLAKATMLRRLVEPFILRRLKTDARIINDLPDKVEDKVFCTLTREQASLYEAVVKDVEERLDEAEAGARSGLILATLMKLKQICNHPAQFLQDGSDFSPERSHKLGRLLEMVEEALAGAESLLIFTQFTEVGAALERLLRQTLRCNTYYLHGGTPQKRRESMIAEFQDPATEPAAFVLSLRAGGTGITLTKASHVFHFDRWWNPAVEDQATDRAFRIGQRRNVFVHKFVAEGTLEERIDQMIEGKKRLSGQVIGTDEGWLADLDNDTFRQLIALQRSAVLE